MWSMAQSSMILFFRGKLFADPAMALRQNAFGVIATAVVLIAAVEIGAPLWIAALVAGLIGGALTASAMNMPYGLCVQDDCLIIADTANSRLLGFDLSDVRMDACASRLAGQPDFTRKGDNRWVPAARDSLCWPYGVAASGSTVAIADSGNNRVLLWEAAAP
jgi:hypothetical protein